MPISEAGTYYESRGRDDDPAVILLEGFTVQHLGWRDEFRDVLVRHGLRVVVMDNRDVGLSRHYAGEPEYTLSDMAIDVLSVLDHLELSSSTIVGQSMGGMIAQLLAIEYPERVDALVLFYTTPALRYLRVSDEQPDLARTFDRSEAIAEFIARDSATASSEWGYDLAWKTQLAAAMYDRNYDPAGYVRQQRAMEKATGTEEQLSGLDMPVTVIHGREDAIIDPRASMRIAELIDSAELHLFAGMGHEVARPLWEDFARAIARASARAAASRVAGVG